MLYDGVRLTPFLVLVFFDKFLLIPFCFQLAGRYSRDWKKMLASLGKELDRCVVYC